MPARFVWLPDPLLSLLLLSFWLLLHDTLAPGQILLGAILGFLIPIFTSRFWPGRIVLRRPMVAFRLVGLVLWDIVVANFAVSRIILGTPDRVKPVFVRVPLDVRKDLAVTMLTSVISLTPGTLAAHLDKERRHLLVHALNEEDPDRLVKQIKTRYEAPIKEIFAC
jgi:multicomponent K+:H+ antiporter subunit E